MYPNIFSRMPGESFRRRLTSLLLCLCDIFRALSNSCIGFFSTGALDLVLFQTVTAGASRNG